MSFSGRVEAPSIEKAAAALDALEPSDDLPTQVLGDCYDELAEAAANDDEHALAARLDRREGQLGCRSGRKYKRCCGQA